MLVYKRNESYVCFLPDTNSKKSSHPAWKILHFSLFTLHFSVCKVTDNFCSFLKIVKKLHHFNICSRGILTFLRASMRHIVMVGQYAPKSI